jgi:hypothetical protein
MLYVPVTLCILWQIYLMSGYPDQRSWKNVGTANTHKEKKSKENRNEIQSPEKYLLLITSWDPFSVPSTSKVHPMGRDKDRYEISAKRTLVIRKRRPRNVNLGICYVPSTSQTSQSDVFGMYMGLHCAIWVVTFWLRFHSVLSLRITYYVERCVWTAWRFDKRNS